MSDSDDDEFATSSGSSSGSDDGGSTYATSDEEGSSPSGDTEELEEEEEDEGAVGARAALKKASLSRPAPAGRGAAPAAAKPAATGTAAAAAAKPAAANTAAAAKPAAVVQQPRRPPPPLARRSLGPTAVAAKPPPAGGAASGVSGSSAPAPSLLRPPAGGLLPPASTKQHPPPQQQQQRQDGGEAEEEEDAAAQAARREANIRALVAGDSIAVTRAPLLAALKVTDADQVLRRPFKSPHPNGQAGMSEALRRKLAARRRFVPWGSSTPFTRPALLRPPPGADEPPPLSSAAIDALAAKLAAEAAAKAAAAAADQELPPGVEPLILWEPQQAAAAAGGAGGAAAMEVEGGDEAAAGGGGEAAADGSGGGDEAIEVDRMLTRWLRPHQREGVAFMFDCVTGLRMAEGRGCILADDMGLGKTLQAITLMWTLLKRGAGALGGKPLARRAIICCPTSLVGNWESECAKWLKGRVRTLALCEASRDEVTDALTRFLSPAVPYDCLIVSYETLRLHAARLAAAGPGACDLLICDEAHRLKNDQTLTNRALAGIACPRRVLLSGTPMQNHLDEFYAMCDFTNPGVLGTPAEFRRHFEAPILAGREPGASGAQVALGEERSVELSGIVNAFILRRTNRLLSAHLPPKVVMVVCCRLSPLQQDLYCRFLESTAARRVLARAEGNKRAGAAGVLSAITTLKKLCNHPKLIYDALHSKNPDGSIAEGFDGVPLTALFPPGLFDGGRPGRGGMALGWEALGSKLGLVTALLQVLRETTDDKVVIVSNYTQTLDLFGLLCRERNWGSIRLDGSTSIGKRTKLVEKFNDPKGPEFVFLLSSKAGGCGLNLVGANRLILFDPDWNPANDKQAAGRVWRDGQKKRVYVYRLLSAGTIEEKVFQRQVSKEGLQQLVDSAAGAGGSDAAAAAGDEKFGGGQNVGLLSAEQLRQLFTLRSEAESDTYDLMFKSGGRGGGEAAAAVEKGGKGGGRKQKQQKQQQKKQQQQQRRRRPGWSDSETSGGGWSGSGSGGSDSDDDFDERSKGSGGRRGGGARREAIRIDCSSGEEGEEEEDDSSSGGGSEGGGGGAAAEEAQQQQGSDVEMADGEAAAAAGGGGGGGGADGGNGGDADGGGVLPPSGHRPQIGTPAEDDLKSFGLHAGGALDTVPDEMLRAAAARAGGGLITFVFSNAIAGKDLGAPAGAAPGAAAAAAKPPAAATAKPVTAAAAAVKPAAAAVAVKPTAAASSMPAAVKPVVAAAPAAAAAGGGKPVVFADALAATVAAVTGGGKPPAAAAAAAALGSAASRVNVQAPAAAALAAVAKPAAPQAEQQPQAQACGGSGARVRSLSVSGVAAAKAAAGASVTAATEAAAKRPRLALAGARVVAAGPGGGAVAAVAAVGAAVAYDSDAEVPDSDEDSGDFQ